VGAIVATIPQRPTRLLGRAVRPRLNARKRVSQALTRPPLLIGNASRHCPAAKRDGGVDRPMRSMCFSVFGSRQQGQKKAKSCSEP
jgi:hypothetical protein